MLKRLTITLILLCASAGAQNFLFIQPNVTSWNPPTFTFTNAGVTWGTGLTTGMIGYMVQQPLLLNRNQLTPAPLYFALPVTWTSPSFTFTNAGVTWGTGTASGMFGEFPYMPIIYLPPTGSNTADSFGGGIIVIP